MKISNILKIGLFLLLFQQLSLVHAASFNCDQAATNVELLICQEPTLSQADDELASLYDKAKEQSPEVIESQKTWVKEKRDACDNADCLADVYLARISELEKDANDVRNIEVPTENVTSTPAIAPKITHDITARIANSDDANPITPTIANKTDSISSDYKNVLRVLGAVIAIILFYKINGFRNRCPECHLWHARKILNETILNSRIEHRTVTKKTVHKNSKGQITGSSEREQVVPYTVNTIEYENKCKHCSHEWISQGERNS